MKSNDQNHVVGKSSPHEQKEFSLKKKLRLAATITMILGFISILAVIFHYLALSDIAHGEADQALEWRIAGISLLILAAFIISTLITLGLLIKTSGLWK
jgi:hypothetical protein